MSGQRKGWSHASLVGSCVERRSRRCRGLNGLERLDGCDTGDLSRRSVGHRPDRAGDPILASLLHTEGGGSGHNLDVDDDHHSDVDHKHHELPDQHNDQHQCQFDDHP